MRFSRTSCRKSWIQMFFYIAPKAPFYRSSICNRDSRARSHNYGIFLDLWKTAHLAFCLQHPTKMMGFSFLLQLSSWTLHMFGMAPTRRQPSEVEAAPGWGCCQTLGRVMSAHHDITKGQFLKQFCTHFLRNDGKSQKKRKRCFSFDKQARDTKCCERTSLK